MEKKWTPSPTWYSSWLLSRPGITLQLVFEAASEYVLVGWRNEPAPIRYVSVPLGTEYRAITPDDLEAAATQIEAKLTAGEGEAIECIC